MTGTDSVWSRERVLGLSPDAASTRAGERLATPAPWSGTGHHESLLWGRCRGSGSTPYDTRVDLEGPAYACSCPSRKLPCKHALGLLLLWSDGHVTVGSPPDEAAAWVAARRGRADRATAGGTAGNTPRDPAAAAARQAQRAERVRLGLEELDVWLADQVRGGLAALPRAGYRPVDQVAARMVDAQAPGVAGMLRSLPAQYVGDGWPGRTLEHLALLRLLVAAHRRLEALPDDLAHTVRSRVGYPVPKESVLALPPLRDRWVALGSVDVADDRLAARRVWVRGERSRRWALLLSFAAGGAGLDADVMPGVTLDAELHFYPGSGQLRGLVGTEHARTESVPDVPGVPVQVAAAAFGDLLVADPWAERLPVVLTGAPVPPQQERGRWWFRSPDGSAVPLPPGAEAWPLLARSMGDPIDVMGEWSHQGFLPLGFLPHPLDPVFSVEVLSA
jgi:hypothetical protein